MVMVMMMMMMMTVMTTKKTDDNDDQDGEDCAVIDYDPVTVPSVWIYGFLMFLTYCFCLKTFRFANTDSCVQS